VTDSALEIDSRSLAETTAIGEAVAGWLRDGDAVLLHGDLGAGKTTLVKGIASGLRVEAVVSSPSFGLISEYDCGLFAEIGRLYHLDLYRLQDAGDLASIGFEEYVAPESGAALVEWPERAIGHLPDRYLLIEMEVVGPQERHLRFNAHPADGSWTDRLADLQHRLDRVVANADE
jgi:tRNA threonylcarbamoyladenosine biosynthesis protein TsaE